MTDKASQGGAVRLGTLNLTYPNGVPELTVSGGNAVPKELILRHSSGTPIARYVLSEIPDIQVKGPTLSHLNNNDPFKPSFSMHERPGFDSVVFYTGKK
ncbi:hypothetical protein [Streptomyces vinaceus]|uniref:hypothetical protein n=1 Tax=Streptomyces vinaceus TaxID=1960 RepID=UPI00367E1589